ncbi:MAG: FHA domain-containing protein [Burkholderiales bacterium]
MEPLAFVEVLGRHGDVVARHPVYRWPVRAGRGYDVEIILDDKFIAPRHIQIEPAADGRFTVTDLDSVNGISLPPSARRLASGEVGPEDIVRLGQTQIRVRAPTYAVQPEVRLRATAMYRRPLSFAIMGAVLLGLVALNAWIQAVQVDEKLFMVFPIVGMCIGVGIWVSLWSLVSRMVGGRANFAAHGFVACAGITALALADTLVEYSSFGLDLRWLGYVGTAAAAAIFAYMMYRHLRLNSRAPRRRLGIIAAVVSVAAFGAAAGLEMAGESGREGMQRYDSTLKPPAFLWVPGITPDAFLAEAARLKRKVDAFARAAP